MKGYILNNLVTYTVLLCTYSQTLSLSLSISLSHTHTSTHTHAHQQITTTKHIPYALHFFCVSKHVLKYGEIQ